MKRRLSCVPLHQNKIPCDVNVAWDFFAVSDQQKNFLTIERIDCDGPHKFDLLFDDN